MAENLITDFSESLKRLKDKTTELESALHMVLKALDKRGLQISLDLDGLMDNLRVEQARVEKVSARGVSQIGRLRGIMRTSSLINSSFDLDDVLEGVMDTVIELTGAERAFIMLLENGELQLRSARNWEGEDVAQEDSKISNSVARAAIDERQPILTTNAQLDQRFQSQKSVLQHALRSIICVPLIRRDAVIGVFYADNRMMQGIFDEDTIPLLTAFADQAAVAIENARLFSQVKADLNAAKQEVARLRIEIDQHKITEQVGAITETDYFQELERKVKNLRSEVKPTVPDENGQ